MDSPHLDSALKVCFAPASTEHLLVATSTNKILWLSTKTGCLLREVLISNMIFLLSNNYAVNKVFTTSVLY